MSDEPLNEEVSQTDPSVQPTDFVPFDSTQDLRLADMPLGATEAPVSPEDPFVVKDPPQDFQPVTVKVKLEKTL